MKNVPVTLGLLIVLTVTKGSAQEKPVCSLLTSREVSVVGATGQGTESSVPIKEGPTKGDTLKLCSWKMAAGQLQLSITRMPPGFSHETLIAQLSGTYATLKAQGWKDEKKDFGTISCSRMTPPAGKEELPMTTGCLTEAKGTVVSVATLGKTRVSMEKVKALVAGACRRL